MKVTTSDLSQLGAAKTSCAQSSQTSGTGGPAKTHGSSTSDSVQFSSTLGSLSRAMGSDVQLRQAKVHSLAAQYQAGTYKPSSAAISRGMVAEAASQ